MAFENWQELADLFEVPTNDRKRFESGNEPRRLWELVEARGRLDELPGHLRYLDLEHILKAMLATEPAQLHPPPATQQHLHTLFFDLDTLRNEVIEVASGPDSVLCLAIPHRDASIGDKVLEWLPYCFPGIQRKAKRSLGPLFGNVNNFTSWLLGFRDELDSAHVGVHIDALRATKEVLADLTVRVHELFRPCPRRFVLLATIAPDQAVSQHLIRLSAPRFRRPDVADWAQRVLADRGWPWTLSPAWVDLIYEYAGETEDEFDPHRTYQVLESSIEDLVNDPARFRRELEQRSTGA